MRAEASPCWIDGCAVAELAAQVVAGDLKSLTTSQELEAELSGGQRENDLGTFRYKIVRPAPLDQIDRLTSGDFEHLA